MIYVRSSARSSLACFAIMAAPDLEGEDVDTMVSCLRLGFSPEEIEKCKTAVPPCNLLVEIGTSRMGHEL
jgi:hypothetical protein